MAWRPATLLKRDSNTDSTVIILQSLKRFLNNGPKGSLMLLKKFLNDGTKMVPQWWDYKVQQGSLMMVLKKFFNDRTKKVP